MYLIIYPNINILISNLILIAICAKLLRLAVELSVAERAARAMPRAELIALPGIGHLSHEEAPARVADAIGIFAAKLTAP